MFCFDCGGTGMLNETRQVECDGCRGAGSVLQHQQYSNTSRDCSRPPGYVICSKCHGRRTLESRVSVTCPHCKGRGRRNEAAGTQQSFADWQSPTRPQPRPQPRPMPPPDTGSTEAWGQLIAWAVLAWGAWWVFGWLKRLVA